MINRCLTGFTLSFVLCLALTLPTGVAKAGSGIDVDINLKVPPPPPLLLPAPPLMVPLPLLIPGPAIYLAPEAPEDLIFHSGYWYRQREHMWFRAEVYNGQWSRIPPGHVPKSLRDLPENLKDNAYGQPRIKHSELKRKWKQWDKEGKWKKKKGKGRKRANNGSYDDDKDKGKSNRKGRKK